jgi:hypothetical protein
MKTGLSNGQRNILIVICFTVAIIGFMVKLPSVFRRVDKELHAAFYFSAAAFLNILLVNRKLLRHLLLFILLFLFGIGIEFAQAYSNRFFRTRIHGRFDPEDIQWNLTGLIAFSLVWIIYQMVRGLYKKIV